MTIDDLHDAVKAIPDGDPESITQYDDGTGHFVIENGADDHDVDHVDEMLAEAGYERDGHLPVPGMVQQNFRPVEDDE
ncbi:hypothetical protein [Halorubrum tebenquichense]|uniref:Uncharacterized protein n=1 Tax=Halorubrum tebenquichense DSM 14210 TaxID=1227485 RepID=M0DXU3_9EURY|nr:hypothetical protein [Halorubrum tebenquichense]ELZ39613.1 hypothetical protein C472_04843 [Halorubrum tebenquichense DSM 14210]